MEIACKMQVQIFHRNDLCITAARCTAFDPEAWAERWLTQCDDRLFPQLTECLSETDARCRLSFSCRRRVDRCHKDQLSLFISFYLFQVFIRDLCFVLSVKLQVICRQPDLLNYLCDGKHLRFLCDFNVCFHRRPSLHGF